MDEIIDRLDSLANNLEEARDHVLGMKSVDIEDAVKEIEALSLDMNSLRLDTIDIKDELEALE